MTTTTFTATDAATSGPDAGDYLWSDPLNWSNGVPVNGDNVVVASGQGIDDITTLSYLDSLTYGPRAEGDFSFRGVSVIGSLTIADAVGGEEDYIYAGTERSQAGSVTIDSIGGTGLLGLDAITNGDTLTVVASSDPNVEYSSAGLLITNATPGADGYLDYPGFSGILALTNPGSTVQAAFLGVYVGVSVELPGSTVTNVAYTGNAANGDGSLTITTDLGTTTFSDVHYGPQAPTGWIASHDATTGLEDITFAASKSTTFTATDAATSGPDVGDYLWSDPLNWSNGVPVNGDNVVIASGQGIDDISTLSYLDSLTYGPRAEGDFSFRGVSVIGSLTIADAVGGEEDYIYAGTERSQAGSVTIDSIGGTGLLGLDAITNGDTLTVVASSDPNVEYSSAGLLITNATPGADGYLDYPGFSGILALTNPGSTVQAAFLGVYVGVSVELPGSTVTNVAYTGNAANGDGSLAITTNLGTTTFSDVHYGPQAPTGWIASHNATTGLEDITFALACFAAGTHIDTPGGPVMVEELRSGDVVLTAGGTARPIRWVGWRHLDPRRHADPAMAQPVRVLADAFGPGVPRQELRLSPDHALAIDGILMPVRLLINGMTIYQETNCRSVTYFHVELDTHDILLAEGLAAESYLESGNRGMFESAPGPMTLHPDFGARDEKTLREANSCLPFTVDADLVAPIWRRLAERAQTLGFSKATQDWTQDASLAVELDGKLLTPVAAADGICTFVLPARGRALRLMSRAIAPNVLQPWLDDRRKLGVVVRRITFRDRRGVVEIPLDHPCLDDGWWSVELDGRRHARWTNGNAVLPQAPVMLSILEIEFGTLPGYLPVDAGSVGFGGAPASDMSAARRKGDCWEQLFANCDAQRTRQSVGLS